MVLLRLVVKIPPRERLDAGSPSPSDDGNDNSGSGAGTKFLIVVHHPENVTIGMLAGLIQDRWKKLRPDVQ